MSKFYALIAVAIGACGLVMMWDGHELKAMIVAAVSVLWVICSQLERLIRKGGP